MIDEELVRKAMNGSEHAISQLYDRYAKAMFRYCFYQLGDEAQAQDLAHDVFVEMLHALKSFSFQGSFKNWLYTIAKRRVFAAIREKYELPKATLGEWLPAPDSADWLDPDIERQQRAKEQQVYELLKQLSPKERKAVELTHLQGFTSKEAAHVTGSTPESIRVRVYRALKKLRA